MGFNVYLPARIMTGNIEFNKDQLIEKVLHNIQCSLSKIKRQRHTSDAYLEPSYSSYMELFEN